MTSSYFSSLLLAAAGAGLACIARRWRASLRSPAGRESAYVFMLVGAIMGLIGWAGGLRLALGEYLGVGLWIMSIVVACRVWERRLALIQHKRLWLLSAAREFCQPPPNRPDDSGEGIDPVSGSVWELVKRLASSLDTPPLSPREQNLLSAIGWVGAVQAQANPDNPAILHHTAVWEATHGAAREHARTRLVYAGMMLSFALACLATLVTQCGPPLRRLGGESAIQLPGILNRFVAQVGLAARWLDGYPLWLLAGAWLVFLPWLFLAWRWNWLGAAADRPWFQRMSTPTSLTVRLLGQVHPDPARLGPLAAAIAEHCTQGAAARQWRKAAAALGDGRPLWSTLASFGMLPIAIAESLQIAAGQGMIVERSVEISNRLAFRELAQVRRVATLLSLACVLVVIATALLALSVWLPLMSLGVPT